MKILLDENLSPTLVHKLGALGVAAEHVVHIGKSGLSDPELWELALKRDAIVATINASDFLRLAGTSALHAGLIILRSQGLDRDAQWASLRHRHVPRAQQPDHLRADVPRPASDDDSHGGPA